MNEFTACYEKRVKTSYGRLFTRFNGFAISDAEFIQLFGYIWPANAGAEPWLAQWPRRRRRLGQGVEQDDCHWPIDGWLTKLFLASDSHLV